MVLLSSVTPKPVREVLTSGPWNPDAGNLAIQVVKTQLANHQTRHNARVRTIEDAASTSRVPSLFDAAAKTLANSIGEDAEEDVRSMMAIESLPPNVLERIALQLDIPYDMFCRARRSAGRDDEGDVDEWVLRNEVWLREISIPSEQKEPTSSKRFQGDAHGPEESDWQRGIIRLSKHAEFVFLGSELKDTCRIITRPTSLPGFKVLDGRRPSAIRIQPSVDLFSNRFKIMTGGLLEGLDWDHVFVAGGIVLSALLCTEDKDVTNTPEQWKNSDVDLYIYGLGPVEANKKIEHIFDVFKGNLPPDAPVLVVRNSKTITFFSSYPLRRIQVVLKLVQSPKDVLLNFDLDICAIGWDGKEVWMLPRAARALETGYTVFTMDLINGHYLGDRRATQEARVFKYADKGYGIRILPSYLKEHKISTNDPEKQKTLGIGDESGAITDDFNEIVANARWWTARAVTKIGKYQRYYLRLEQPPQSPGSYVTKISHANLQERDQITEDPQRRSALSGLTLFMRHAALWEHEVIGNVIIEKDIWASPMYDGIYVNTFGVSYNDVPDYSWDDGFTAEGFASRIDDFNKKEDGGLTQCFWSLLENKSWSQYGSRGGLLDKYLLNGLRTQRVTYATTVHDILQPKHDIYLPVWLPKSFIDFAEDLIPKSVRDSGVSSYTTKPLIPALKEGVLIPQVEAEGLQLVFWHITNITMWQQLDRTIDEVHEVLWSFHHSYAGVDLEKATRMELLVRQFARRAIRMTTQEEYSAFARWVAEVPADFYNRYDDVSELLKKSDTMYDEPDEYSSEEYIVPNSLAADYDGKGAEAEG